MNTHLHEGRSYYTGKPLMTRQRKANSCVHTASPQGCPLYGYSL